MEDYLEMYHCDSVESEGYDGIFSRNLIRNLNTRILSDAQNIKMGCRL
jgi:hypothetical protein